MKHKRWIAVAFICLLLSFLLLFYFRNIHISDYTKVFENVVDSPAVQKIRVGTYNIKSLNMGEGLDSFTKEMSSLFVDVVCLQEVDQNASRSHRLDMVKSMAQAAGYPYYYFFPSMWMVDGYYGLGILSRYPLIKVSSMRLPNGWMSEPRILVQADILIGDRVLHIYNTHVSYKDREMRKKQVAFIGEYLKGKKDTILMGDFNIFSDADFFDIENMHSINRADQHFITFRDFGFPDNIFYSDNLQAMQADVLPSAFSDHNFLYCDIRL